MSARRRDGGILGGRMMRLSKDSREVSMLVGADNMMDSAPEDTHSFIRENLCNMPRSEWNNTELLYFVKILKRAKPGEDLRPLKSIRFLVLIKKKDFSDITLLQISIKNNSITVKHNWPVQYLKALDFNGDDELKISSEKHDHIFIFESQNERNECIWILGNICRTVEVVEIFIGYSVDMEAIGYQIIATGLLDKFPGLQKQLFTNGQMNSNFVGEEDSESELLLEELNWASHKGGAAHIQQDILKETEVLNMEIIDFLLQWEEFDPRAKEGGGVSTSSAGGSSGNGGGRKAPERDTGEIMAALDNVDAELGEIDYWLERQLTKLEPIQDMLKVIEDENGGLESTWTNLTSVSNTLTVLVESLQITPEEEAVIKDCEHIIVDSIKTTDVAVIRQKLAPLIASAYSLKRAISFKGSTDSVGKETLIQLPDKKDSNGNIVPGKVLPEIKKQHWKQIQSMTAVADYKRKLTDVGDAFFNACNGVLSELFLKIVSHKSLNSESDKTKLIAVKSFNFSNILLQLHIRSLDPVLAHMSALRDEESELVRAQAVFHGCLMEYKPIFDILLERSPASAQHLSNAYIEASHDGMYNSIFKHMWKEIKYVLHPKHSQPVNLANIKVGENFKKFVSKQYHKVVDKWTHNDTQHAVWEVLEMVLMKLLPVLSTEERFYGNMFAVDEEIFKRQMQIWLDTYTNWSGDYPVSTQKSAVEKKLMSIFQGAQGMLESLILYSSTWVPGENEDGMVDVVEIVGCLTVLYNFALKKFLPAVAESRILSQNPGNPSPDFDPEALTANDRIVMMSHAKVTSVCSLIMLNDLRNYLLTSIQTYLDDQYNWILDQKSDPKKAGVSIPVAKYVALVKQIHHMLNGSTISCVNTLLAKTTQDVFDWLGNLIGLNEKYGDIVVLNNFYYIEQNLSSEMIPALASFLKYASDKVAEAEARYTLWMVTYELSALAELATRLEGVGSRVREEELSLYVRRKDVITVAKELDHRKLVESASNIVQRLIKHFRNSDDQNSKLIPRLKDKIRDRATDIVKQLETISKTSYQIDLEITAQAVREVFDKAT